MVEKWRKAVFPLFYSNPKQQYSKTTVAFPAGVVLLPFPNDLPALPSATATATKLCPDQKNTSVSTAISTSRHVKTPGWKL